MNGGDSFFVDTNLLLYAVDASAGNKQEEAELWLSLLWEHGGGRLSWQVLHEFYSNSLRNLRRPPSETRDVVESFAYWQLVEMCLGLVQRAWRWMDQAQLPYWDSLIVAAAERAGCAWLLSEDFQAGRKFGPVTVVNPFLRRPEEFGLLPRRSP